MRGRILQEQSIVFFSIVKWFILATVAGVIVGLSTTGFLKLLFLSQRPASLFHYYFLLLPVGMALSISMIKRFAPDAQGHGTEKVIEAVHKRSGKIVPEVVPVKLLASLVTLAVGGSVGKEGPCAQIGGGCTSILADLFRFNDHDRRKLVICGISAGFASVFGAPIAGAVFGVEVLFIGTMLYDVLLPSFVAGVISFQVSSAFGIMYFRHPITFVPVFSEWFFLVVVFSGIVSGIWSAVLIVLMQGSEALSKKIGLPNALNAFIGGCILVGLTFLTSRKYLGLGLDTIEESLGGTAQGWHVPLLKSAFTGLTLGFGGSGGIVTPIFFIGATSGSAFAAVFGLDRATFAAIGLVSVLAGAAQTPIAASIMAVELFGAQIAPYAAVACVISFLMTGYRSVYPSQVLAVRKYASLDVAVGETIENVHAQYQIKSSSVVDFVLRTGEKVRQTLSRLIRR